MELQNQIPPYKTKNYTKTETALNRQIEILTANGNLSATTRKLKESIISPPSEDTYNTMKNKHPNTEDIIPTENIIDSTIIDLENILENIRSFKKDTTPGPDGFNLDYIKCG